MLTFFCVLPERDAPDSLHFNSAMASNIAKSMWYRLFWKRGASSRVVKHEAAPPLAVAAPAKPPPPTKRQRVKHEFKVRDALAAAYPGSRIEVPCSSGIVDILTDKELIEVKRAPMWKAALGQVLAYSSDFPRHRPRVHLFGPDAQHFYVAAVTCERFGVRLTVSTDKEREVDLLDNRRDGGIAQIPGSVLRDDEREVSRKSTRCVEKARK